jgi:precorrin-6Y C5,15-methyltransferase (decarboxylating)
MIIRNNLAEVVDRVRARGEDSRVVVLASGDPLFYGIADFLLKHLSREELEVIPNVSSMQSAFARIKESWQDAFFISAHGRGFEGLMESIRGKSKIGIFTDSTNTPAIIAREMCRAGLIGFQAAVCEDLGRETERITWSDISSLVGRVFSSMNVMILLKENLSESSEAFRSGVDVQALWVLGLPDSAFEHRSDMITKQEVRALVLSKLRLRGEGVLWDIGAGCGSVSIEAALLAPQGMVYAVEREQAEAALVRRNLQRFGLSNVKVVQGAAPEVLGPLPIPEAIFVGGSGGRLPDILEECWHRLKPDGTLVVNAVTWDSLTQASTFFQEKETVWEMVTVNLSRTKEIKGKKLFEALNPIYILSATLQPKSEDSNP